MGKEEKRVVLAAHEEAEQPAAEENTDWRNAGSIRDYLDAIGEQIENPHARCAIRREIGNHIEEQTEDYEVSDSVVWHHGDTDTGGNCHAGNLVFPYGDGGSGKLSA